MNCQNLLLAPSEISLASCLLLVKSHSPKGLSSWGKNGVGRIKRVLSFDEGCIALHVKSGIRLWERRIKRKCGCLKSCWELGRLHLKEKPAILLKRLIFVLS